MKKLIIIATVTLFLSACVRPYSSVYVDDPRTNGVNYDFQNMHNNNYRRLDNNSNYNIIGFIRKQGKLYLMLLAASNKV